MTHTHIKKKEREATNEATGCSLVTQMAFSGQRDSIKGHHDSAVFSPVYFWRYPFRSKARDFSSLSSRLTFFLLVPGIVAEQFLNNTATQLTYHGLCELTSTVQEGELCVFFRNNHFSTMIKFKVGSTEGGVGWCGGHAETHAEIKSQQHHSKACNAFFGCFV